MNIRSLTGLGTQILLPVKAPENQSALKTHDTADRDADGRMFQGNKKRKVTEEELKKIIDSLKANPGVVANHLIVMLAQENEVQVILIKSPEGQVLRRITEENFYQFLDNMDLANGRILNKAA
jgi:uncharacterized FlaG/YvyC family protein